MSAPDTAVNDDAALRTLADYYRAFSTLEVQAVWPYFHAPSLLISPQGVFAVPTFAALATVFTPTMEGLRTREFSRSELSAAYVKSLSASATLVTGIAIRYKRNGQELERAGVAYVLHKAETGWKIAVIILHDGASRPAARREFRLTRHSETTPVESGIGVQKCRGVHLACQPAYGD